METEVAKEETQNFIKWTDSTNNTTIKTTDSRGFLCHIYLETDIEFTPLEILKIFNNPDNSSIFRDILEVGYREVLEEDDKGNNKVIVEQKSGFNFLMIPIRFSTFLTCETNISDLTFRFELFKRGIMKKFTGLWTLTEIKETNENGNEITKTRLVLEQDLLPSVIPPFSRGIFKRISQNAILRIVEDLQRVLNAVKSGKDLDEVLKNGFKN